MKRFILSLLICLIAVPVFGASTVYRHLEPETVAYNTLSSPTGDQFTLNEQIKAIKYGSGITLSGLTCKLSLVNGTAFITNPSVDLRQYVGYKITITETTHSLEGWIAQAGAGEALGDELLSNPTVDVNTTGWYTDYAGGSATIASVAGGQSGNCLEITGVSGTHQQAGQTNLNFCNKLLKMSGYVKSGTSGDEAFRIYYGEGGAWYYSPTLGITSSSWVPFSYYLSNAGTEYNRYLGFEKASSTPGTMLYDELSIRQLLAPSLTGVTIVSTQGGTTYNWASNSGILPNTTSFTAVITAQ